MTYNQVQLLRINYLATEFLSKLESIFIAVHARFMSLPLRVNSVLDSYRHDSGILNAKNDGLKKDLAKSGSLDDDVSLNAEARYDFCVNTSSCIDGASSNSQGSLSVGRRALRSSLDDMMNTAMVINCCILMVALVNLHGAGLSSFNIWVSTTHCLVAPLVKNILIYCVKIFSICIGHLLYHSE